MSRVWLSRVYDATSRPLGPHCIAVKVFGGSTSTYYLSAAQAADLVMRLNRGIAALRKKKKNGVRR